MKLTKKEVQKISKLYGLGKIQKTKIIKSGLVNYNFDVITQRGEFIFRFLKKGKGPRYKNTEFKVLNYLRRKNFPYQIPIPLKNKKGKELTKINDGEVWVYRKIDGVNIKRLKDNNIKEVAKALAIYHKIIKNLKGKYKAPSWFSDFNWLLEKFQKMKNIKSKNKTNKLMLENINLFEGIVKKNIKLRFNKNCLITHCDINEANLLWKRNKLVSILDFDNCSYRPRIFDIATAIIHLNGSTKINKKRLKLFLKEYQKINKLSKEEIKMIFPLMLRHLSLIFEWFYNGMKKRTDLKYNFIDWTTKLSKNVTKEIK